jgi:hypothetical protein
MEPNKVYHKPQKYFPTKRNPYKKYENANWQWIDIFNDIKHLKETNKHAINIISNKYKINYNTLKGKYKLWLDNGCPDIIIDNRGKESSFTEEEERTLYEYIKEIYIDNHLYFDDTCLKILAQKKWNLLEKQGLFKASKGWIYDFKYRWNLSTRSASYSKKASIQNDDQVQCFISNCITTAKIVNKSYIFNMDETFWRIINGNPKVIGITGTENRKVLTGVDLKSGFTAIFIITADGLFLKPIIILKGKTSRCLKKTNLSDDSIICRKFSPTGWINTDIMKYILKEINKIANGNNSVLILDQYSVHTDEIIKKEAAKLNIKLIYVPVGKTSTNQPLDVCINGPIKSIGKKLSKEVFLADPFSTPTIADSIKSLILSIKELKKETIIKSFAIACGI